MSKETKEAADFMPKSEEALRLLRSRAQLLAQEKTEIIESHAGIDYVRFDLGKNELYGIPYQYVKEVLHNVKPARLPLCPNFIAGVLNWRGALIPVIDLRQFLHSESAKNVAYDYGIIVRAAEMTIGILAVKIAGSDTYQPLKVGTPLSSAKAANPEFIIGIHDGVTAIVNVEATFLALRQEMEKIGELYGR